MLDGWCEGHGARVLVTPGQISSISAEAGAHVVVFRCVCGHEGRVRVARRRRR